MKIVYVSFKTFLSHYIVRSENDLGGGVNFCYFLQNIAYWIENSGNFKSSRIIELWLTLISLATNQSSKNLELSSLKNTIKWQFFDEDIISLHKTLYLVGKLYFE